MKDHYIKFIDKTEIILVITCMRYISKSKLMAQLIVGSNKQICHLPKENSNLHHITSHFHCTITWVNWVIDLILANLYL